jgi:cbb3-type cytochrome oxidase maturation protein
MSYFFLIPISIALGLTGLGAFFWAMRHDQYDDLDGAAARILIADSGPLSPPSNADRDRASRIG